MSDSYLHGFSKEEQDRLYRQARFLEPSVYQGVDFTANHRVLEVGCGVGAQTEILLERFPHLHITGVDASSAQLDRARQHLSAAVASGKVEFIQTDAKGIPAADSSFDGAFVCWLLEHVENPVDILTEIHRTLKPGASIYINEVLNATFYLHPYSPATLKYWFEFNDHQWNLKGDPFVGAKLANLLLKADFQNVITAPKVHHYDNRTPKKRAQFIEYWCNLLLSGAPGLIQAGKVTPELVAEMKAELETLRKDPDSVFFYSWIFASAQAL